MECPLKTGFTVIFLRNYILKRNPLRSKRELLNKVPEGINTVPVSNAHEQFSFLCVLRVLYIEDPNEHIFVTSVQIETCVSLF